MRNYDIQSKLISDTLTSQNALNLALVDKKGISNHLKMTTTAETQNHHPSFNRNSNAKKNQRHKITKQNTQQGPVKTEKA